MDPVKIAEFLFTRIQQTISQKRYIKEVKIGYSFGESYGNTYITLTYELLANADFYDLPLLDRHTMFQGTSQYTYSISSNSQSERPPQIMRIIAFKNIYESITAYATLQLEAHLLPNTAIKIDSIHLWPNASYAEKYLNELVDKQAFYPDSSKLGSNIWQWESLHQLALESKKKLSKEKSLISDLEIFEHCGFSITEIRRYVIHHQIPIKVKGVKIISQILISVPALLHELKTNASQDRYDSHFPRLIDYLYNHYLPDEKAAVVQDKIAACLQSYMIQPGDLVTLNDNRIVQATAINMDTTHHLHITYTILRNNLQLGGRTRTVDISQVSSVLKTTDFQEYLNNNHIHHVSLLKRWMKKKEIIVTKPEFNLNFR